MDMSKLGGDSQNTMPIAINSGMQARQIVQATQAEGAKFSFDAFKQSLNANTGKQILAGTQANLPIADALQQQGMLVRWSQKIPWVGQKITQWLGADGAMNKVIGELGKDGLAGMSKTQLTSALYKAGSSQEISAIIKAAKINDPAIAKMLAEKAEQRLVSAAGQALESTTKSAVTEVAEATTRQATVSAANAAEGVLKGLSPTTIEKALPALEKGLTGGELATALKAAGLKPNSIKSIMTRVTTSTVETTVKDGAAMATKKVVTETTEVAAKTASKGGIKGFFGKLLGGAKGNFIVAGVFSLASNAIQLAQGKIGIKQFVGLTVLDTAAYGAIGWGSAAAGAAIGTALFPGVGTIAGFVIGLGLGFLGGHLYEKFIRNPIKNMLGGPAGGAANPADPYTAGPNGPTGNAPAADPYAGGGQQPAYTPPAYAGSDLSYDQALAEISRMGNR
ncbi:MAG: hypothetical protein JWM80_1751 [Cyanobacteria bacterium RYN_339]|nr:hypothetical protein [Cyanobacteria bacterium RYN_339]